MMLLHVIIPKVEEVAATPEAAAAAAAAAPAEPEVIKKGKKEEAEGEAKPRRRRRRRRKRNKLGFGQASGCTERPVVCEQTPSASKRMSEREVAGRGGGAPRQIK